MTYADLVKQNEKNSDKDHVSIIGVDFTKNIVNIIFLKKESGVIKCTFDEIVSVVNTGTVYIINPDILENFNRDNTNSDQQNTNKTHITN